MRKVALGHGFVALRVEGGLLPPEFLHKVAALEAEHQMAADYGIPKGLHLKDEIGRAWRIAKAEWQDARRSLAPAGGVALSRWWRTLLQDVLGYRDLTPRTSAVIGDRVFPINYKACGGAVPLVLTTPEVDLERPDPRFGDEHRKRSAHALLQEYLNAEQGALWGIVSNERHLRLLRDNPSLTRPAYIEADLERIFAEDLYADFAAFWLLCHASRLEPRDRRPDRAVIEIWRETAHQTGERALANLREGVTEALRQLGNGFITRPENATMRERLSNGSLTAQQLFQELLRLVYRLLFLFTAEERHLLHAPGVPAAAAELYRRGYSLARLRDLALRRRQYDEHIDLWEGLKIVFRGLAGGCQPLGLPGLGGLFQPEQCPTLDAATLGNAHLLRTVRALSFFGTGERLARVNYRDMGTEELGSVYESLLELQPVIEIDRSPWRFSFVGEAEEQRGRGSARKLSGSYYTPPSLVQELIKSALEPVIEQTIKTHPSRPVEALLGLTIIDPACGSGHFLLAAARRLAADIARLTSTSDVPDEEARRHALREVVRHCIYGVDKNPMAVELCKTALWIETIEPGKPLSFLDAHIRCGDSLLGIFDPEILDEGIPAEAYKPSSGDDPEVCQALRKANREMKLGQPIQGDLFDIDGLQKQVDEAARCEAMPEDTLEQIAAKQRAWEEASRASRENRDRWRADLFVGAFMAPKTAATRDLVPTNADLNKVAGHLPPRPGVGEFVRELAYKHQFFHWFLEFPHILAPSDGTRSPGFDVVLGNPPWERIKIQEQEFFAARSPKIAAASNQAARARLIAALNRSDASPADRALWVEFQDAKHEAEAGSQFVRQSGRFPLTGCGDVNTYALFAELFLHLVRETGRAGLIVPSGIATDDSTKRFFGHLTGSRRLLRLADFENRQGLFPEVHKSYKFALLTIGQSHSGGVFSFFAQQTADLADRRRIFTLSPDDIALINPNTRTCPVFRTMADAELTKMIYRRVPVLIDETRGEAGNPWGISFLAMFHMSNDSKLFKTFDELRSAGGLELRGNRFVKKGSRGDPQDVVWLPLYEAKMIHQYDHRWATYETSPAPAGASESRPPSLIDDDEESGPAKGPRAREVTLAEKADPHFEPLPRYWVPAEEVTARLAKTGWPYQWLMGWRDIARATDERTVIATVFPKAGSGDTFLLMFPKVESVHLMACLLADQNSLVHDFIARQKIGGTHLKYHVKKQIVNFPPKAYLPLDIQNIVCRVWELYSVSIDMACFSREICLDSRDYTFCSSNGYPNGSNQERLNIYPYDYKRRATLRAELDAYFAYLYGLNRKQLRYILDPADLTRREVENILDPDEEVKDPLDRAGYEARVAASDFPGETFRVLKEREIRQFGEYRTRRLVLEAWERFTADGTFARRGPPPDFSAEIARAHAPPAPLPATITTKSRKKRAPSPVPPQRRSAKQPEDAFAQPTQPTLGALFDQASDQALAGAAGPSPASPSLSGPSSVPGSKGPSSEKPAASTEPSSLLAQLTIDLPDDVAGQIRQRVIRGIGGFQSLLIRLQQGLQGNRLTLTRVDLERLRSYTLKYGQGGFQGVLKKIVAIADAR